MTYRWLALLLAVCLPDAARAGFVARMEDPAITESSGVAASRARPGVYWTHNDSGAGPVLYAFDSQGRSHGRWRVRGAGAVDWEDIAIGPGVKPGRWDLYIADIGDNARRRREVIVYRVEEPDTKGAACRKGCNTARATAIRLRYPDGPHNAEALLVHPATGDLYIVTKAGEGEPTGVYKARPRTRAALTLSRVATVRVPESLFMMFVRGGITGGDISPDGRRVVLCDYFNAYEAVLPAAAAFDTVWDRDFSAISLGIAWQVEGICYRADGRAIIATSEGQPGVVLENIIDVRGAR